MPTPAVFQPGVGAVSADNLNNFVQTISNFAQLRTITGLSDMQVSVLGTTSENDGGQGSFYWSSTSTAADNNTTVIVPYGSLQGAWLRLPPSPTYLGFGNLPTTLPPIAGVLWNNGGSLCIS